MEYLDQLVFQEKIFIVSYYNTVAILRDTNYFKYTRLKKRLTQKKKKKKKARLN